MIVVTRLNGHTFAINPDLVARIEANPDTTISLVDGTSYLVTETVDEVIERIADSRARVVASAHDLISGRLAGADEERGA